MERVCIIDTIASHYRKAIFSLIDKEFDVTWCFGDGDVGVKEFCTNELNRVIRKPYKMYRFLHAYSIKGISSLLNDHDIIIVNGEPAMLSSWVMLIKNKFKRNKTKIYFWTHGWYGKEGMFKRLIKKIYFKLGTGIITYGDYAKKLMIKEGFNSNTIWAIHNSLDYSTHIKIRNKLFKTSLYQSHFDNNYPVLLFIGRLTPVKKLDELLYSIKILEQRNEEFNLVMVGDGEMRENLMALSDELNLSKRIWFYGSCYDERRNAELIYNSDLCVSPGNVGLTAIHSLTFGTPVCTHNNFSYQMPEFEAIIEGKTGCFFMQDDVDSLADAISEWFKIHNDREFIRLQCFKEIEKNWNPFYQISVLKKVIANV